VSRGHEIDCFAASAVTGGGLGHLAYDGQKWGDWELLGGSNLRQKPACLAGPGQQISCVALDLPPNVNGTTPPSDRWWYYHFDGQAWQPAEPIPFANFTSTLRPMCTATAGDVACFAVDRGGQLWMIERDQGDTWGSRAFVTSGIAEPPHCLASGARLDCFSRSTGNQLISGSFDGASWSAWLPAGSATVQSQPYCNRLGSGFDCYWTTPATGEHANELHRMRLDHGLWLPEEELEGNVRARPECLATPGGQRIDCFAQGTSSTLQHRAFD
jgi:hypothetical protein